MASRVSSCAASSLLCSSASASHAARLTSRRSRSSFASPRSPCRAVTTRRAEGDALRCDDERGSTRASARSTSSMSRAPAAADALPMGGVDGDIAAGMTSAAPQCDASAQSVNVTFRSLSLSGSDERGAVPVSVWAFSLRPYLRKLETNVHVREVFYPKRRWSRLYYPSLGIHGRHAPPPPHLGRREGG